MSNSYRENDIVIRGDKGKVATARIVSYIFLAFVTFLSLFSFYILLVNATRSNAQIMSGFSLIPSTHFIDNIKSVFFGSSEGSSSTLSVPVLNGMFNSFLVAATSCILTTYFSAMTAYGIHVYDFRGKKVAFNFILIVMMIPTQISAVGFVQMVRNIHLNNTFWPLIIPAIAAPSVFFYMKQYIESSLPLEVIEAARVDGSNEFRTFNFIALPMLKPAMAVQLIFAFVASWNNLFTPALVLDTKERSTLPILLSLVRSDLNSQRGDYGAVYMLILLAIIPVVIVYIFLSRNIVEGVALGAVKG